MVAIVNYNAGNVLSVQNALSVLGFPSIVTNNKTEILKADKVIIPGVGQAGSAMETLREQQLHELFPTLEQPVLGICLGMQLMCNSTEESNVECLGIFNTPVNKFPKKARTPHMGWNNFETTAGSLFQGIENSDNVYYAHSFYISSKAENTIATCEYEKRIAVALCKNNFYGVQFHPEKSGKVGQTILKNFLTLCA